MLLRFTQLSSPRLHDLVNSKKVGPFSRHTPQSRSQSLDIQPPAADPITSDAGAACEFCQGCVLLNCFLKVQLFRPLHTTLLWLSKPFLSSWSSLMMTTFCLPQNFRASTMMWINSLVHNSRPQPKPVKSSHNLLQASTPSPTALLRTMSKDRPLTSRIALSSGLAVGETGLARACGILRAPEAKCTHRLCMPGRTSKSTAASVLDADPAAWPGSMLICLPFPLGDCSAQPPGPALFALPFGAVRLAATAAGAAPGPGPSGSLLQSGSLAMVDPALFFFLFLLWLGLGYWRSLAPCPSFWLSTSKPCLSAACADAD